MHRADATRPDVNPFFADDGGIDIFSSIISSESFDGSIILSVASIDETSKYFNGIGFCMNGINPSVCSTVIYERDIVIGFAEGGF